MQATAYYAHHHFKSEVAGWAHWNAKKGIYKLAPLMEQEITAVEVETFPNEILSDTSYDLSDMCVQWHSHVYMGCTPSQTDNNTIKDMVEQMPLLISIIINCKMEYTATVTISKVNGLPLADIVKVDAELIPVFNDKCISKQILSKLKRPKPKPVKTVIYDSRDYKGWGSEGSIHDWDKYEEELYGDYIPPKDDKSVVVIDIFQKIRAKAKQLQLDNKTIVFRDEGNFAILLWNTTTKTKIFVSYYPGCNLFVAVNGIMNPSWHTALERLLPNYAPAYIKKYDI